MQPKIMLFYENFNGFIIRIYYTALSDIIFCNIIILTFNFKTLKLMNF